MAWAPVVEKSGGLGKSWHNHGSDESQGAYQRDRDYFDGKAQGTVMVEAWKNMQRQVTDYRPTCECGETCETCAGIGHRAPNGVPVSCPVCAGEGKKRLEPAPGIVLDIFGGSGTTGMVAKQLMRRWVVMDISRPYLDEQAKVRTGSGTPANALDGLPMFGGDDG